MHKHTVVTHIPLVFNMIDKLYTPNWINLDPKVRDHLRKIFNVKKTGNTEIRDQVLISDGTTNEDLWNAFTVESMTKYTGGVKNNDFAQLWTITVSKANYEINPPVEIVEIPKKKIENTDFEIKNVVETTKEIKETVKTTEVNNVKSENIEDKVSL